MTTRTRQTFYQMVEEDEDKAADVLVRGEEVVVGADGTGLMTALFAWNLAARILSRVLLLSVLRFRLLECDWF